MSDVALNNATRFLVFGLGIELSSKSMGCCYDQWLSGYSVSEHLDTFLDIAQRVSKAAAKTLYVLALDELSPCIIKHKDVVFFQSFVWGCSLYLFVLFLQLTEPYFDNTFSKEATKFFDFISHLNLIFVDKVSQAFFSH